MGLYPLWEGRSSLVRVARGIMLDLRGGKGTVVRGEMMRESVSSEEVQGEKMGPKVNEKTASDEVGEKKFLG